jgi:hypothetical protein
MQAAHTSRNHPASMRRTPGNFGAMRGPLPDPDQRRQMVAFVDGL